MKSIKLTDSELILIREHYEAELEAAKAFIIQVEVILKKLGSPKKTSEVILPEKEEKVARKRGRKPGKKASVSKGAPKKRGRKPKNRPVPEPAKDTSISKPEKKKPVVQQKKASKARLIHDTKPKTEVTKVKAPTPSKKVEKPIKKKRRNLRPRKGVFLTPLSKPLKPKASINENQASDNPTQE